MRVILAPLPSVCWLLLAGAALLLPVSRARAADTPSETPLTLEVDASRVAQKILHAHMTIATKPGHVTLLYPKWIPGEHAPTGPITDLVGLKINAGGKRLPWRRDAVDMFAIHCDVPEDVESLDVVFDFLLPGDKEGFSSAASSSARLAVLSWNQVLLYPKGASIHDMQCRASVTLPAGWKLGTALPVERQEGPRTDFGPVSLETLVDSPVLCGVHFKEVPVGPSAGPRHYLLLACDSAAGLEISSQVRGKYDRLVAETGALFGTRHYSSYRFLVTLSDQVAHFGLEHHQCSDDRGPERMFVDADPRTYNADLLPHEFVHSWNGKYRRPADMVTADFQVPQRTHLLWVYEGLTQYLGLVLTARSGLCSQEQFRDRLAVIADWARNQRGRSWRSLEDTAIAAQLLYAARDEGTAWRRGVDFYDEGVLLWLEVDTLIRQRTKGARSLDDFCRRFYAGDGGKALVKTYTLDDMVKELNAVAPYDWADFFDNRLSATTDAAPLTGITRGGWKLVYNGTPSDRQRVEEAENKKVQLGSTLGLVLKDDGTVADVIPEGTADRAGIGPGMKLIGVNSRRFSVQGLRDALAQAAKGAGTVELLLENGDFFHTCKVECRSGERCPHLERDQEAPRDVLADILKPRAPRDGAEPQP